MFNPAVKRHYRAYDRSFFQNKVIYWHLHKRFHLKRSWFMAIHLNGLEAKTSHPIRYYKDILCAPVWIPNLCILDKIRRYRCSADCSNWTEPRWCHAVICSVSMERWIRAITILVYFVFADSINVKMFKKSHLACLQVADVSFSSKSWSH